MNGAFGAAFDFDGFYAGGSNQQQQQQPQHTQQQLQQSQRYIQQTGPCYEGYDPSAHISSALLARVPQYGHQYDPTGLPTHHAFIPSSSPPNPLVQALDPVPITSRLLQRQQQQQQQHYLEPVQQSLPPVYGIPIDSLPSPDEFLSEDYSPSPTPLSTNPYLLPDDNSSAVKQADVARKENPDQWLDTLRIPCPDVSIEPLSGADVLKRVRSKTDDVVTRYLPCVEFLVACQQDLRTGLAAATQQRLVRHSYRDSMSPREFHERYLEPLPDRFYQRNKKLMEKKFLNTAVSEVKKLCANAKEVEHQGCEVMKNTFLGGMKDGESWGLRKWLSKHGGALHICNDLECILRSCQALERSLETTRLLAERLRPLAKQALERLKNDVPSSYQEVSSAHPYLPFFHRLESALKSMSNFDPDDDDVICIDDDDEIEEMKQKAQPKPSEKRKATTDGNPKKRARHTSKAANKPAGGAAPSKLHWEMQSDDDDDGEIEVVEVKTGVAQPPPNSQNRNFTDGWDCPQCSMPIPYGKLNCSMCGKSLNGIEGDSEDDSSMLKSFADIPSFDEAAASMGGRPSENHATVAGSEMAASLFGQLEGVQLTAGELAQRLEQLACTADADQHRLISPDVVAKETFWDLGRNYASALRIFASILRNGESRPFFEPVNDEEYLMEGRPAFSSIVRHMICFRDITTALCGPTRKGTDQFVGDGRLPDKTLSCWNMWRGMDLLQAIDLVLLNKLAYLGKEKSKERTMTQKLRKLFWEGVNGVITPFVGTDVEKRRQCTPTRRGITSGFVIRK